MARCQAASLIPPKIRESALRKRTMQRKVRAGLRPQEASDGEDQQERHHTQDTLTGVSQLFGEHEDIDPESDPGEKVQTAWQKQRKDSPKEDSPKKNSSRSSSSKEEPPTNEALRDGARQKVRLIDTRFDAWCRNKIAKNVAGWAMRDTMICDLPKHGKMQPTIPTPWGRLWITWQSARSLMAYGQTSTTYAASTS